MWQCPPGYENGYEFGGPNSCYKFVHRPRLNWADASLQCQSDGGHLVVPETPEEDEWLAAEILNRGLTDVIWLGGSGSDSGEYSWVTTRKPPEYDAWDVNDRKHPNYIMGLLLSMKTWYSGYGGYQRNYVCEVEGF